MTRRNNKISRYHNERYWEIFMEQCSHYDSYRLAYEATEQIYRDETYKRPSVMSDAEWHDLRRYDTYESFRVGKWDRYGTKKDLLDPSQLTLWV